MDLEAVAKAHAESLNKGILAAAKDIGFKITLGFVIIAIAIYAKK